MARGAKFVCEGNGATNNVAEWVASVMAFEQELHICHELGEQERTLARQWGYVSDAVAEYCRNKQQEAYYNEFMADHGSPDLWEDHLKQLKFHIPQTSQVHKAVLLWAERGEDPMGKTLGEVLDMAKEWDTEFGFDESLPKEFIIPPPPTSTDLTTT